MNERHNTIIKSRSRRVRTQHSYVDQISIEENQQQYNYENQQFQPIPETIEHQIPSGLYRHSQHSSISQIFKHIQNPINYQQKTSQEIRVEKHTLEGHVKFLNQELNDIVNRKVNKIEQGFSRKIAKTNRNNSRLKYNEWDDAGIQMQITNNHKLLILLRQQFHYLKAKLTKCQQSNHKIKCQNQIAETKQNITKMKLFLIERKRKNVLAGKKITEITKKDMNKVFFDLQQQFVTLSKKKQEYLKKLDKVDLDNANLMEDHSRSEDRCIQLKHQAIRILTNLPNQFQQQHNKVMYDTKCRKMELSLRKRERDDQNYKRKYYQLLKQYELVVQNIKQLDRKLRKIMEQTDEAAINVKNQSDRIQQIKSRKNEQQSHFRMWKAQIQKQKQPQQDEQLQQEENQDNQNAGFMLTELSDKNTASRATKRKIADKNRYKTEPTQAKPKSLSEYNYKNTHKLAPLKVNTEQYISDKNQQKRDSSSREQSFKNSRTSQISDELKKQKVTEKSTQRNKPSEKGSLPKKQQRQQYSEQIEQQIQYTSSFQIESP